MDADSAVKEEIVGTEVKLELEKSTKNSWHSPFFCDEWGLLDKRMMILSKKGLRLQFSVPTPLHKEEADECLKNVIRAARIIHLDWVELYFAEDDDFGPFSLRNELEALSSVLSSIKNAAHTSQSAKDALLMLRQATISEIASLEHHQSEKMNCMPDHCVDAASKNLLVHWERAGIVTKLDVAYFKEAGRGLVASEDINIGDVVLEVPMKLVISDSSIDSHLPELLKERNFSFDDKRCLWMMKEIRNTSEKFKALFDSFPKKKLKTASWFGPEALRAACDTPLGNATMMEKQDLKEQFDSVIKPVLKELRQMFPSCGLKELKFASGLWNCYSVNVMFPGEEIKTCLVPVAGFFNHSQLPHILYGNYDSRAHAIQFIASRPCSKGEQCYLSYGNFPGDYFATFYGFLPKGVNYHDVIRFDFDIDLGIEDVWPPKDENSWPYIMARKKRSYSDRSGLTRGLLAHMKAIAKKLSNSLSNPSNKQACERLKCSIYSLIMQLENVSLDAIECGWDVKLAYSYREQYEDLLSCVYRDVSFLMMEEEA